MPDENGSLKLLIEHVGAEARRDIESLESVLEAHARALATLHEQVNSPSNGLVSVATNLAKLRRGVIMGKKELVAVRAELRGINATVQSGVQTIQLVSTWSGRILKLTATCLFVWIIQGRAETARILELFTKIKLW